MVTCCWPGLPAQSAYLPSHHDCAWLHLTELAGVELQAWAQQWLRTPGLNVLAPQITAAEDGTVAAFAITQAPEVYLPCPPVGPRSALLVPS